MEENDIQLRTEEVNELLGAEPNWVYRWGILTIFIIMLLGLVLSFFIRYPDILTAKTTITTLNPPVTLVSKTDGKIISLQVKNNQFVKEHDRH
jgi:multidrug efflux pump subunit AcrA (membrane-fusion protein)